MDLRKLKVKRLPGLTRGFTLYELLISIAVITIVAGIVMYNHKRFETDIEVTNLGYRMALEIRQAQVYGISVRQQQGAGLLGFDVSYGVHFDRTVDNAFILFADADGDGIYDPAQPNGGVMDCPTGTGSECVEKFTIGRNNKIIGWCGILWSNIDDTSQFCIKTASPSVYTFFDIKFKRPNPDAVFRWYPNNAYNPEPNPHYLDSFNRICDTGTTNKACNGYAICIESPQGRRKRVVVYETGQISVENVQPDTTCSTI